MEWASENAVKDDAYYFDDGSHEFRVGNYLFRLHRSILQMHSTFFRNMFDLPQGSKEGSKDRVDEEPTVCDDEPEAFRALCWAVYADPLETSNEREITATNVKKITHIGLLAHKYEFQKIEQWIIDICGKLPPPEALMNFQLEDLTYLAHVVSECEWVEVKNILHNGIIDGVLQEKDLSAMASASTLCKAVHVADHINDEVLRARAYYFYLASTGWDLHPGERQNGKAALTLERIGERSAVMSLSSLTDKQKLCLFRGLSSLQTLRNRLCYFPVAVPFPDSCDTTQRKSCHVAWKSWWLSQLERIEGSVVMDGPLQFLHDMTNKASKDPPRLPGHEISATKECAGHVISQLTKLKEAFRDDLRNYFN